jgi:hypothetical protein
MSIFDYKWKELNKINDEQLEILYRYNMLSDEGKDYFISRLMKNNSQETNSRNNLVKTKQDSKDSRPDTQSNSIKDSLDKDYNKELNNKRLMALSGMNPYD